MKQVGTVTVRISRMETAGEFQIREFRVPDCGDIDVADIIEAVEQDVRMLCRRHETNTERIPIKS